MSFQVIIKEMEDKGDVDSQIRLWQLVLEVAEEMYEKKDVYWVLDGFAIAGAKLKVGNKGFRMERGKGWNTIEWEKDRQEFLMPHKTEIKYIFQVSYKKFI